MIMGKIPGHHLPEGGWQPPDQCDQCEDGYHVDDAEYDRDDDFDGHSVDYGYHSDQSLIQQIIAYVNFDTPNLACKRQSHTSINQFCIELLAKLKMQCNAQLNFLKSYLTPSNFTTLTSNFTTMVPN